MMALKFLTIVNASVTLVFFCLSIYELIVIAIKALGHDSFQAINELKFEELVAPSITLCPGPAFKRAGPFLGEQEFTNNKYTWEEIFHPKTLATMKNESLFTIKETYASYYGVCFTMQKLTPEKVSDYSFQIVLNNSIDYIYYLHEPHEENHLLMSVYPYEVPLIYMDSANTNGMGGIDIIYKKEIVRKIAGKGGCEEKPISEFIQCLNDNLVKQLVKADVKCKVPALTYTEFNTSGLEYCNNKEDGLAINGLIYELAQKTQKNGLCGSVCSRKIYSSALNYLSERVLSKELKVYGKGYCIIWAFYSSLYVNEKIETYVFDFDTALVAVGGSLGLFLGWSCHSIIMGIIEFLFGALKLNEVTPKNDDHKGISGYVSVVKPISTIY